MQTNYNTGMMPLMSSELSLQSLQWPSSHHPMYAGSWSAAFQRGYHDIASCHTYFTPTTGNSRWRYHRMHGNNNTSPLQLSG